MPSVNTQLLQQPSIHIRPSKAITLRGGVMLKDKNAVLHELITQVKSLTEKSHFIAVTKMLLNGIAGKFDNVIDARQPIPETEIKLRFLQPIKYITGNESKYFGQQKITRGATLALYALCIIYKLKCKTRIKEDEYSDAKKRMEFVNKTINEIMNPTEPTNTTTAQNSASVKDLEFNVKYFTDNPFILNGNSMVAFAVKHDGYNLVFKFQDVERFSVMPKGDVTSRRGSNLAAGLQVDPLKGGTSPREMTSTPRGGVSPREMPTPRGNAYKVKVIRNVEKEKSAAPISNFVVYERDARRRSSSPEIPKQLDEKGIKDMLASCDVVMVYDKAYEKCSIYTKNDLRPVSITREYCNGKKSFSELHSMLSNSDNVTEVDLDEAIGRFLMQNHEIADRCKLPLIYDCPDHLISAYQPIGNATTIPNVSVRFM